MPEHPKTPDPVPVKKLADYTSADGRFVLSIEDVICYSAAPDTRQNEGPQQYHSIHYWIRPATDEAKADYIRLYQKFEKPFHKPGTNIQPKWDTKWDGNEYSFICSSTAGGENTATMVRKNLEHCSELTGVNFTQFCNDIVTEAKKLPARTYATKIAGEPGATWAKKS